jgi:predicted TIM-barrel fold metal-dependent hydrolase
MGNSIRSIDCFVNTSIITAETPGTSIDYLFKGIKGRIKPHSQEQLIKEMDEAGVEKAILVTREVEPKWVTDAIKKYPDRFIGSHSIDPLEGMEAVRKLERAVKDYGFKAANLAAFRTQKPYNDKVYYPIYAKCIELDIPIRMTVGIPGPRVPGEVQNPIYLDEVCWFFPELKVVMSHGGEPWVYTCVKLMLKWPNLYYMTSAFAPKYYPQEIIHYLNTRGSDKVMFATASLVPQLRAMNEIQDIAFKNEEIKRKFLRENALRLYDWNNP